MTDHDTHPDFDEISLQITAAIVIVAAFAVTCALIGAGLDLVLS